MSYGGVTKGGGEGGWGVLLDVSLMKKLAIQARGPTLRIEIDR